MVDGGFFLVMVSTGHDPRSENDERQLKFSTGMELVNGAYANEVPTELAYDIFDTFRLLYPP